MACTVETVVGPVDPTSLGRTLTHEHLSLDFSKFYVSPPNSAQSSLEADISLESVGFLKQYPYSSMYNLAFHGDGVESAVLHDVQFYKSVGGGTIIENTSIGLQRQIGLMQRVARKTGVNIVAGTGYYVEGTQSKNILTLTEEQMYDFMLKEMTIGCEDFPNVKCGFIGEVGSSWPITDFEKRAIRSTASAQSQLKCAVSFHPGRDSKAPAEIMRIFLEAGGDPKRSIMSHLDRTFSNKEQFLEFAELGCFCQLDLFGTECSWYQLQPNKDMPSDAQRIDMFRWLVDEKRISQLLGSHDIHTRHRLMKYGGHGFGHLFHNVIPKMRIKGFSEDMIDEITIHNPRIWLTGKA